MAKVDDQKDGDADVRGEEVARAPVLREEDGEAVDEQEKGEEDERDAGAPRLQLGGVGDVDAGEVLCEVGLAEAQVGDGAADPGDEARGVGQVHEPVEDDTRGGADVEVAEGEEESGCADGHVGNSLLGAFGKDLGGVAGDGEGVEGARGHVHERVTG